MATRHRNLILILVSLRSVFSIIHKMQLSQSPARLYNLVFICLGGCEAQRESGVYLSVSTTHKCGIVLVSVF